MVIRWKLAQYYKFPLVGVNFVRSDETVASHGLDRPTGGPYIGGQDDSWPVR